MVLACLLSLGMVFARVLLGFGMGFPCFCLPDFGMVFACLLSLGMVIACVLLGFGMVFASWFSVVLVWWLLAFLLNIEPTHGLRRDFQKASRALGPRATTVPARSL